MSDRERADRERAQKVGRARVFVGMLTSNFGNRRHVHLVWHADGRMQVSVDLLLPQEGVMIDDNALLELQEL